jgi:hypothetical protein
MCFDRSWQISASIAAWPLSATRSAKKAPFWHATFYLTALGDDCAYQRPSFKANALYYCCTTSTCNLLLFFTAITISRYARIRPLRLTTQRRCYAPKHLYTMSLVNYLLCTIYKRIPYRQAPTLHQSFTGPYYLTSVFAICDFKTASYPRSNWWFFYDSVTLHYYRLCLGVEGVSPSRVTRAEPLSSTNPLDSPSDFGKLQN